MILVVSRKLRRKKKMKQEEGRLKKQEELTIFIVNAVRKIKNMKRLTC